MFFLIVHLRMDAQIASRVTGTVMSSFGTVTGAQVRLVTADDPQGASHSEAVSDSAGRFDLGSVPQGRYLIQVEAADFAVETIEWLVTGGKDSDVDVMLTVAAAPRMLDQVEVRAVATSVQEPGSYSIAIEKTLRLPANFFDPLRLVSVLPGAAVANDQGNAIAIRGYSPNALLWRLEGLDIVNPNHLANAGTLSDRPVASGGGVSILSSQVLGRSDFRRDALPLSVGNVLSGALDMSLRKGNRQKSEYTVQAGLIGLDLAAEGPVGNSGRSSFVADVRYSTVGLLGAMGVNFGDEQIDFSDVTFHLNTEHRSGGDISLFGFTGISRNRFAAKERALWLTEKDRYDIRFNGVTFGLGVRDTRPVSGRTLMRWGLALSGQFQDRESTSATVPVAHVTSEDFRSDRLLLSSFVSSTTRLSPDLMLETGLNLSAQEHQLRIVSLSSLGFSVALPNLDGTVSGALLQPYAGLVYRTGSLEWHGGFRYLNFTWNRTQAWEPRVSVVRRSVRSTWSMGYGHTHQQQSTSTYLQAVNTVIPFTRARQLFLEHQWVPSAGLSLRNTIYYHVQSLVPMVNLNGVVSSVNQFDELFSWSRFSSSSFAVTDNGTADHLGWETMAEKRFDAGYYLLASGSLYRSRYGESGSDKKRESRFSGRYTLVSAAGKEWQRKRQVFGLHGRLTSLGGQRMAPIDEQQSADEGTTVFDHSSGYTVRLADYFRIDLRLAWRKNKPGRTRTLSLDIQNLLNRENAAGFYFDTFLQEVQTRKQLGIIPTLTWRLDF